MSPADCCGQCRHIRICRERCGVPVGEPAHYSPAPPIAERRPGIGRIGALAIFGGVTALGLPLWSLAGMLP